MKLRKALLISIFAPISLCLLLLSFELFQIHSYQNEVQQNASKLSREIAILYDREDNLFLNVEALIDKYIKSNSTLSSIEFDIKQDSQKSRAFNDVDFSSRFQTIANFSAEIEKKLKNYKKQMPSETYAEYFGGALKVFLLLLGILWMVPRLWYFSLDRIRELSAAIVGKK